MTSVHVRAPATTANVGPGFDCVALAFDLWNELEVSTGGGPGEPADRRHLGVQAFARLRDPEGLRFRWTTRIPRGRGLGSSASVIALGLVAATLLNGDEPDPEELLAIGLPLEGHPDNLAAALAGGVVLTWSDRIVRIADTVPAEPVLLIPAGEVSTRAARAALPETVTHVDAAYTAARAALLGAALSSGSSDLFACALDDRLHEPYRARTAHLFEPLKEHPPAGAIGVTISGSGPTICVWARPGASAATAEELRGRFPEADVRPLAVSPLGAGAVPA